MRIHEELPAPALRVQAHEIPVQLYQAPRVRVVCLECSSRSTIPITEAECDYCGSSDLEVA
jgi:Zn finger protein HypA/HybF involved in hydrogenase expression